MKDAHSTTEVDLSRETPPDYFKFAVRLPSWLGGKVDIVLDTAPDSPVSAATGSMITSAGGAIAAYALGVMLLENSISAPVVLIVATLLGLAPAVLVERADARQSDRTTTALSQSPEGTDVLFGSEPTSEVEKRLPVRERRVISIGFPIKAGNLKIISKGSAYSLVGRSTAATLQVFSAALGSLVLSGLAAMCSAPGWLVTTLASISFTGAILISKTQRKRSRR